MPDSLNTLLSLPDVQSLPVVNVLSELRSALANRHEALLKAAPGAGKTTLVPLALLQEPWLSEQKILMLEPRRLAARSAAHRMAELLGETVGKTVGYRIRLESKVSDATRIEVITEGILSRMLHDDPSLEGVGLIIFDEFHERSIDADLGLSFSLHARSLFRDPSDGEKALKILLMSATLDDERIPSLLSSTEDAAPVIESEGRQFPVTLHYAKSRPDRYALIDKVIDTILMSLEKDEGSLLVFLPGQAEIRKVHERLVEHLDTQANVLLCPLFGDLSLSEQRKAIEPAPASQRKIVLATSIAESSLTIEGVRVVIDSGLSRVPRFDPKTAMTRLETKHASQASTIQRMGRAGRLEPGVCYRLWNESQQTQLEALSTPEIAQADLAPLALQLLAWGVESPNELLWLDAPPTGPYEQALELLVRLGAIERSGEHYQISSHGELIQQFSIHPRLAHMLVIAESLGQRNLGAELALLLSERDILGKQDARLAGADIEVRLQRLGKLKKRNKHYDRQISQFSKACCSVASHLESVDVENMDQTLIMSYLIACAYPDRVAKRRFGQQGLYRLANGRAVSLDDADPLQAHEYLVVPNLGGHAGQRNDIAFMAAAFDPEWFEMSEFEALNQISEQLVEQSRVIWDEKADSFVAEKQRVFGCLIIDQCALDHIDPNEKEKALLAFVRKEGLGLFKISAELQQWIARVNFLYRHFEIAGEEREWPDFSDSALLQRADEWLSPALHSIRKRRHFEQVELKAQLMSLLPWPLPQKLDELAPERIEVPSGSKLKLDYTEDPPILSVKLQEMFGCQKTPTLIQGKVPVRVHLLSPAQRPLAVTQDLSSFWESVYPEVKKEMKGRYPKHPWPDDPLTALATAKTKARM